MAIVLAGRENPAVAWAAAGIVALNFVAIFALYWVTTSLDPEPAQPARYALAPFSWRTLLSEADPRFETLPPHYDPNGRRPELLVSGGAVTEQKVAQVALDLRRFGCPPVAVVVEERPTGRALRNCLPAVYTREELVGTLTKIYSIDNYWGQAVTQLLDPDRSTLPSPADSEKVQPFGLYEVTATDLTGMRFADCAAQMNDSLLVGLRREGELYWALSGHTIVLPEDRLVLISRDAQSARQRLAASSTPSQGGFDFDWSPAKRSASKRVLLSPNLAGTTSWLPDSTEAVSLRLRKSGNIDTELLKPSPDLALFRIHDLKSLRNFDAWIGALADHSIPVVVFCENHFCVPAHPPDVQVLDLDRLIAASVMPLIRGTGPYLGDYASSLDPDLYWLGSVPCRPKNGQPARFDTVYREALEDGALLIGLVDDNRIQLNPPRSAIVYPGTPLLLMRSKSVPESPSPD